MPCFLCKSQKEPFHKLESGRLKLFRKVYFTFQGNSSVLCEMCFKRFDYVFRIKAKQQQTKTSFSQSTAGSFSSVTKDTGSLEKNNNTSKSSSQLTTSPLVPINTLSSSTSSSTSISPLVRINTRSQSMSSSQSVDSTDRLVQLAPSILSLRDSTRRATPDVGVVLARQGAEPAEQSALKRKRTREVKLPNEPQTPLGRQGNLQTLDEEKESSDDEEIQSQVSYDLALTGPIVKRRKEKVVFLDQRVMDVYLANTSGG